MTTNTLSVGMARPLQSESWSGLKAGLRVNDQILQMHSETHLTEDVVFDGSVSLLNGAMARLTPGELVTVQVLRPANGKSLTPSCANFESVTADGVVCNYSFRVVQMPLPDFLLQFGVGFIVALILLAIGGVTLILRWWQSTPRLIAVICAAGAFAVVGRFELLTTFQMVLPWSLVVCVLAGALLYLAMSFPYTLVVLRRTAILRLLPVFYTVIGFIVCVSFYRPNDPITYNSTLLVALILVGFAGVALFVSLLMRRRTSTSVVLRDQATLALLGISIAVAPQILWVLTILGERVAQAGNINLTGLSFSTVYLLPPLVVFPLGLSFAVLQYRKIDTDRIIGEGLIYSVLGVMLIFGYLLITSATYFLTSGFVRADNPILIAITLFIIALLFTPMRLTLGQSIDRAFFRQRRIYEKRVEQFARSLTTSVDLADTVSKLKEQLEDTVAPRDIFFFLLNLMNSEYEVYVDPAVGHAQTDIRFSSTSPLVQVFSKDMSLLHVEATHTLPPELVAERARLAVLNTPVIVRLQSVKRLNGFLALGPRQDGSPYGYEDLRFIESLAEQAASAFERAQMIIEAQRNANELRVLAQVSAALNIVMDFDTLLEFVYAQVDKVISAPNFYIALREPEGEDLYYTFYQEEGDRVPEREGYRWHMGRDLISEVVRSGQPIRTDNYLQEMARRDPRVQVENSALRGWMGVPLNAGGSTALGCLAVATTEAAVTYTADQIRIFWNIADLAATAIYKTRLFSQAEERARQMKALNDISSKLASEFENLDALLQVITDSAIEILRGEAGSLLLRDDATGDLIFQLAVGGSGQELVGSRIPAGSGIAGTVVQTGRHVIVNDTQQDARWYGEIDPDATPMSRFNTRAILAVPLTTRAGVIGVLEVINKRDGTAFVEDEVNLLTLFAGQAAVAIENARLFQMTDKALAERVQQLDNMQRIDQELNRTLDFRRVVDLTIDNSIRESGADTGALLIVNADPLGFEVAGSVGYPDGILSTNELYPITLGIMGKVYRTRQPALITQVEMQTESDHYEFLPGAQSQLAVPLFTGTAVSGVLVLESLSSDIFTMVTSSFIQGLAEHANTAITNAQLFSRLEEANEARSKFVGFVAHELKNPMASIKGYAEVLLGGMTGAMSEQQQNFIAVIRRNVVRMQQLVDDLKDLTAQERGQLTLRLAPVSFNNVILETLRPQQRAIDEKNQTVNLNFSENLPLVWGDELRLIQIMTNFVSNANKYTPPDGAITIMAEVTENKWNPNGSPEVIHCAIVDTGIGMDDEDLKKLFTPYWRSENARAREQPGTGLGMTLTRGLVEQHGGTIWVESIINVGTTFHFTVPLAPLDEKANPVVDR
ncbi:MAG: GAF domain-containing protein [Chloroflexota bacterium]